jgi:hypothetical protein
LGVVHSGAGSFLSQEPAINQANAQMVSSTENVEFDFMKKRLSEKIRKDIELPKKNLRPSDVPLSCLAITDLKAESVFLQIYIR